MSPLSIPLYLDINDKSTKDVELFLIFTRYQPVDIIHQIKAISNLQKMMVYCDFFKFYDII